MAVPTPDDNSTRPWDEIIDTIVDYTYDFENISAAAWQRAKTALLDALGSAIESLHTSKDCAALVGPVWPNTEPISGGFRLPGTKYSLDLLQGAFSMGTMIRYLDHNDAFPGAEWGHPSDNLGAILATADILTRRALANNDPSAIITMGQVLEATVKAYEIQGCFQIRNAFNRVGLDHVILVKVAATAVVAGMLMRLPRDQARAAVAHAWVDGHPLRIYRQAPNTSARKGWAAGDACMRAVHLASVVARAPGPASSGARTALTEPRWGFCHVLNGGRQLELPRPLGSWVAENVIFKVTTAEGHGLTALEATLQVVDALGRQAGANGQDVFQDVSQVKRIHVRTQAAAMTIINKQGPLHNAADRDHCLRYMMAVTLLKKAPIETADYQDGSIWANSRSVEALRSIISMEEDPQMTLDYHDPSIRSVASAVEVELTDDTRLTARVDFPLGHVSRDQDTLPLVREKAIRNLELGFSPSHVVKILEYMHQPDFDNSASSRFIDLFHA